MDLRERGAQLVARAPAWAPYAVVAALALVLGLVAGVLVDRTDVLATRTDAPKGPVTLSVGPVEQAPQRNTTGWDFEVAVLSPSAEVDVQLVGLQGLLAPFRSEPAVHLTRGSWGTLRFTVPVGCDTAAPRSIPEVELRVRTSEGTRERVVALPDQGRLLLDYLDAACGTGREVSPTDLAGAWIVEEAFGPDTYAAGQLLLRFGRSGDFASDRNGDVLTREADQRGRFRLQGEELEITNQSRSGCGAGAGETWRAGLGADGRLTMVFVDGDCPEALRGSVWVLRRLVRE